MHLLAARPSATPDAREAVDPGQTPGAIVVLTAADSEIACLAAAQRQILRADPAAPTLRVANLLAFGHPYTVDLYGDAVIAHARVVIIRLLGGRGYWPYGVERITALCRAGNIPLAWLPGDDKPDPELAALSTLPAEALRRLWLYGVHGGLTNAVELLRYAASLIGCETSWREPSPLLRAGLYWPGDPSATLETLPWRRTPNGQPVAAIIFYRALVQAGDTWVIDALAAALQAADLNPLPVYAASLRDQGAAAAVARWLEQAGAGLALNATAFALSRPGVDRPPPFEHLDGPVLQVVCSGGEEAAWRAGAAGLSARDIAMNVALPEMDGRILSRAVSFKDVARRDETVQWNIVTYRPVPDRCAFVADLAAAWMKLRATAPAERRLGIILANYPNRDARLGNGVGLDTPASVCVMLEALRQAGYRTGPAFADGDDLIRQLAAGPTNAGIAGRTVRETLPLNAYQAFFEGLPAAVREAVTAQWGAPVDDPFFLADAAPGAGDETGGGAGGGRFALPILRLGNMALGVQPARGYHIDPVRTYHSPDLAPPHGYLAFYAWLRTAFCAHAVIHAGKHGNLEWLPGKAVALSDACFPEAALGPMPHLYPFIVNDPGEGTQAKRRAQAVIIDHLTPPLTRAESYGPLRDLEHLVDEYCEAAAGDPRRLKVLRREIVDLARRSGLDRDSGMDAAQDEDAALACLDGYLCELKEMQIRDGLHVFGRTPEGGLRHGLLAALARAPRGAGDGDASLLRALAADLDLGFDPLDADLAAPWTGPRPALLQTVLLQENQGPWRTAGDTVERLEALMLRLVAGLDAEAAGGGVEPAPGPASAGVLRSLRADLAPRLIACGEAEIAGLLQGLDGRFVPPGPSGAPSRGRPDTLPTGRNFYSVDTRAVPTPAAWTLGWRSAQILAQQYAQTHGRYPTCLALSAWGTANMRTGGDDVAQALALMGARPTWDSASRRVTGFEIMPLETLGRPRVDVTLRVSGFFRDAFPNLIELVDAAARAVAALEEPEADNPLAAAVRRDRARLEQAGAAPALAARQAGARVFGSKPGAYGAGLQALIDEGGWTARADLARAYLAWGGYAYGAGAEGAPAQALFEARLSAVEAVLHNQDNREHDLLDSDDYYQFEGGLAAAVELTAGAAPTVYHNDHSRPESPKIRTLEDEIARVVRARVVNPKWIRGVMRHGYKGGFEMAATVDYLFAFAATTGCVADHHFDAVYEAYLADPEVTAFLEAHNPAARRDIAARLKEALERGLWRARRNDIRGALDDAVGGALESDESISLK